LNKLVDLYIYTSKLKSSYTKKHKLRKIKAVKYGKLIYTVNVLTTIRPKGCMHGGRVIKKRRFESVVSTFSVKAGINTWSLSEEKCLPGLS
jgi:hypothetical protein